MANEKLSKELILKIYDASASGYKTIARSTGYSLEVNKETVDITSFDSAGWKEFLVDLKDWSISADGIVVRTAAAGFDNYEQILTKLIGSDVAIIIQLIDPAAYTDATDGTLYSHQIGSMYLTSLPVSGAVGDKQTYSLTGQGTGDLTMVLAKYDSQAEAFTAEASYSTGEVILVEDDISGSNNGYYSRSSDGTPASFAAAWSGYTV